jgi:hypothetical protein
MLGLSAGIGVTSGVVGLLLSYHANLAAGGTIVLVATALFGIAWLLAPAHGLIASRLTRRRAAARADPGSRVSFEAERSGYWTAASRDEAARASATLAARGHPGSGDRRPERPRRHPSGDGRRPGLFRRAHWVRRGLVRRNDQRGGGRMAAPRGIDGPG